MSTMYDALRKAESERKKVSGVGETKIIIPSGNKGDASENTKIAFLVIALIAVAAIGGYRFNSAKMKMSKPVKTETKVTTAAAPAASTLAPVKAERAPGTYGLDGVIDAGAGSMAIINGKLLKVDESIDQMVLKKISPKEVEMLNTKDSSTVILKLN